MMRKLKAPSVIFLFSALWIVCSSAVLATEPRVYVQPENPRTGDSVVITVSGWLPDPCYTQTADFSILGSLIDVDISSVSLNVPCITVIADYTQVDTIYGLPDGYYTVQATETMYNYGTIFPSIYMDERSFVIGDSSTVFNGCVPCIDGDADGSGIRNIGDVTFLISLIFGRGPAPACDSEGDANQDGSINISDVTTLIQFIFGGAPLPSCR